MFECRTFITVKEICQVLSVSESKSYAIVRDLNKELSDKGYMVIPGRVTIMDNTVPALSGPLRGIVQKFVADAENTGNVDIAFDYMKESVDNRQLQTIIINLKNCMSRLLTAPTLKPHSGFWKTRPSDAPTGTGKSTLCRACFYVRIAAQKCTSA